MAIFIFLVSSSLYFLLHDGLYLDHLDLPGLKVEKLYIKWDEKLKIEASRAYLSQAASGHSEPLDYSAIARSLRLVRSFNAYVGSIAVGELHYNDAVGSIAYNSGAANDLVLTSERFRFRAGIDFSGEYFRLDLKEFADLNRSVSLHGSVVTDLRASDIYADLNLTVGTIEGLRLFAHAGRDALAFSAKASEPLTDLRPITDAFALPEKISRWIVDYAAGNKATLHTLYGTLPYDDPGAALRTLHARATVDALSYRFHPQLEPIHTQSTELIFENGILNILPSQGRFYGHDGGRSWLNIDFTAPKITLNAFIRTEARLDANLLNLLHVYHIDLPFRQLQGLTRADLALAVTLATGKTTAEGSFHVDSGRFRYLGLDLDVNDAEIGLVGADVTIDTLRVRYGTQLLADVKGHLNPAKKYGHLQIIAREARFGEGATSVVLDQKEPLHLDYIISRSQDKIVFEPSHWRSGDLGISMDAATVPFDFASSTALLDEIPLRLDKTAAATVSGNVNFKNATAELDYDIRELHYRKLRLAQPHMRVNARYDGVLHLSHPDPTGFDLGGTRLQLGPLTADINGSTARSSRFDLRLGSAVSTAVSFDVDTADSKAALAFERLDLEHNATGAHFVNAKPLDAELRWDGSGLFASSDDLSLGFIMDPQHWELNLNNLSSLSPHLPILQRFELEKGTVKISHDMNASDYRFSGSVATEYPLLIQEELPVSTFGFEGRVTAGGTLLNINDAVAVSIDDVIRVTPQEEVGVNLVALIDYIKAISAKQHGSGSIPAFTFDAEKSFVYLTPTRRAIADAIHVTGGGDGIYARLLHEKGTAVFEFKENLFSLHGDGFGDRFMRRLLALAEYRGGSLSFHVNGTTTNAHGVARVKDTVVRDYRALNNILAFINTVPALATFSLPHYSDTGLEISDAYASFHYDNGLVTVDGLNVDSHEIDMTGNGTIDYVNNTIDMRLNLITDVGENVSKIPLVGYILVGERGDVTTTLKIEGDLNDPKVTNDIAENIVVSPFKMIMRTLTLPFKLLEFPETPEQEK